MSEIEDLDNLEPIDLDEDLEEFKPIIQWDGMNFIYKEVTDDLKKQKNIREATHFEISCWLYEYVDTLEPGEHEELECLVKYNQEGEN